MTAIAFDGVTLAADCCSWSGGARRKPIWDKKLGCMVQSKRATPHRVRNSTEDLSIKQYSDYIDRIIARATTEWSVNFHFLVSEREAVRYVRPVAKRKVDETTGEILETV